MAVRLKKLKDQAIVLTGATSGIGLATARLAARRGARLVLVARNEQALAQLVHEIHQEGGEAVYVAGDVGDEEQVEKIVRAAESAFGGFDTWINDAGVSIYGGMLDVATEDHRRLFETNFWGVVYGSLAAARALRDRPGGMGGAIINVGSEVSDRAVPVIGMYSASKHAVKGFTDALRMELEYAHVPVSVTLVKPGATDTPFAQHAKNYMEEEPKIPTPMDAPEVVARTILHCTEKPERDVFVGAAAKRHSLLGALMPRVLDRIMEKQYFSAQKSGKPARRAGDGLYKAASSLRERGESEGRVHQSSVYTAASLHPLMTAAVLGGLGFCLYGMYQGGKSA